MTRAATFDAPSRARIGRAVRKIEKLREPSGAGGNLGSGAAQGMWGEWQFHVGKTAASIPKGISGPVNIYFGTTKGSETWDGSTTVSAYNRFADVGSGKWVFLIWILGGWELIAAEC